MRLEWPYFIIPRTTSWNNIAGLLQSHKRKDRSGSWRCDAIPDRLQSRKKNLYKVWNSPIFTLFVTEYSSAEDSSVTRASTKAYILDPITLYIIIGVTCFIVILVAVTLSVYCYVKRTKVRAKTTIQQKGDVSKLHYTASIVFCLHELKGCTQKFFL